MAYDPLAAPLSPGVGDQAEGCPELGMKRDYPRAPALALTDPYRRIVLVELHVGPRQREGLGYSEAGPPLDKHD